MTGSCFRKFDAEIFEFRVPPRDRASSLAWARDFWTHMLQGLWQGTLGGYQAQATRPVARPKDVNSIKMVSQALAQAMLYHAETALVSL